MDKIVDQAWASLLASVMKKRNILRPEIGDEIDLYLPQSRLLSLAESNAETPRLLYDVAKSSAERNARSILKTLGMPADYFWKFEYWPKARALTNLTQIVTKVFSAILTKAKEGNLEIVELDVDPLRININFDGCVECAGLSGLTHGICFYHAGTFAGIFSSLINRSLDSFETDCCVAGNKSCSFIIGDKDDKDIKAKHGAYVSSNDIKTNFTSRLENSLRNQPARTIGNLVDVNYYRLVIASTLLADPKRSATTNFEVGLRLGRKLAPELSKFYGHEGLANMKDFYSQLGEFRTEVRGDELQVELAITECPETIGPNKISEMMSFLLGELQGLTSELTKRELVFRELRFEGDKLVLIYAPKT